jgi:membrane protease YdiL (CAAX protease family)
MSGPRPGAPRAIVPSPLGPRLDTGDVARTIALGLAAFLFATYVLGEIAGGAIGPAGRINYAIAYYAAWCFAWLGAVWLIFVRRRGASLADLGYVPPQPVWAMRAILAGFIALPAAFTIYMILRPVMGTDDDIDLRQSFGGPDFSLLQAVTLLLYAGLLVPVAEELVYRGLIFRWLRDRLDFRTSALISAAAFGLSHRRVEQMVIAGLLGLVLAWFYERSRSLLPSILLHQTYNCLTMILTFAAMWFIPAQQG